MRYGCAGLPPTPPAVVLQGSAGGHHTGSLASAACTGGHSLAAHPAFDPCGGPSAGGASGGPSHALCPPPSLPGLRDTEWLGRTQVLPRGPVTWYLDGAHTTSSIQACVRWFRQAALNQDKPHE